MEGKTEDRTLHAGEGPHYKWFPAIHRTERMGETSREPGIKELSTTLAEASTETSFINSVLTKTVTCLLKKYNSKKCRAVEEHFIFTRLQAGPTRHLFTLGLNGQECEKGAV